MRRLIKSVILIGMSITLLTACTSAGGANPQKEEEQVAREENTLVIALNNEPEAGFDPTTGWGTYGGSPLFHSTLVYRDTQMAIQNDLATGYEVEDAAKIWTFKLREDAYFTDGTKVTAHDVKYTYEEAAKSGSVMDLTLVEKMEVQDDYTITFYLKESRSTFINVVCKMGIVPQHLHKEGYGQAPIGSGPYKFVKWDQGQQLIIESNKDYYKEIPAIEKITFLFLSEDTAFAAAKAGEVDIAQTIPTYANQQIEGMHIESMESVDNRGIAFPTVKSGQTTEDGRPIGNDVTADVAIRKAINIAINRQEVVDGILQGYGTPAYTECDKMPWWNEATVFEDGDTKQAQEILKAAGWVDEDNDGILEKEGLKAEFKLLYTAGDDVRQSLAMYIKDTLEKIGIAVTIESKSWDELTQVMFAHPIIMGWGNQDPIELYNLYSTKSRGIDFYNTGFYSNPKVDEYLNEALRTKDEEEANAYFKKAQWDGETGYSVLGDAAWSWIVNINHLYFVRDNLDLGKQKIHPHGHDWPVTDNITEWKFK